MDCEIEAPRAADIRARIALRKAQHADIPELRALHRTALLELGRSCYSEQQIDALLCHVPTLDEALIADQTYFVAEIDGSIVACGGWSRRTPGYQHTLAGAKASPPTEPARAVIRAMYTHPAWARRGLGRRILSAAETEARQHGEDAIELDALHSGIPLYLGAGYASLGERALTLPERQSIPVLYMRKQLKDRRP